MSNNLPFRPGLESVTHREEVLEYPQELDISNDLVRVFELPEHVVDRYPGGLPGLIQDHQALLSELSNSFGIPALNYENKAVITGPNEYAAVVERIGQPTFTSQNDRDFFAGLSQVQRVTAAELLEKEMEYIQAKTVSGEPFLDEAVGLHQYTFDEAQQTWVMVDMDPSIVKKRGVAGNRAQKLLNNLDTLLYEASFLFKDNDKELQVWRAAGRLTAAMIVANEGLQLPEERLHELVEKAISGDPVGHRVEKWIKEAKKKRAEAVE